MKKPTNIVKLALEILGLPDTPAARKHLKSLDAEFWVRKSDASRDAMCVLQNYSIYTQQLERKS